MNYIDAILEQIKQPLWESWYIKEKIGDGSFSDVYRIEAQRPSGVDVAALKIEPIIADGQFFSDISRKTTFLNNRKQMAINEVQIMKKLRDCPFIVRYEEEYTGELYIDGKFEGYYYLIKMELLKNVFKMMKDGKFSFTESNVRKLALEIGQGIKAAHSIGVIHRDIKPENMFVNEDGIYKLGDFNISKKTVSARTVAGTQYYMAPEIYSSKLNVDSSYTTQADIYSFGLCLYQMMNNGQLPFEDTLDPDAAYEKRMSNKTSFSKPCNASLEFSKIILKACAYDLNKRYKSIDEMMSELSAISRTSEDRKTQYAEQSDFGYNTHDKNMTQYADYIQPSQYAKKNIVKSITAIIAIIVIILGVSLGFSKCNNSEEKSQSVNSTSKTGEIQDSESNNTENTNNVVTTNTSEMPIVTTTVSVATTETTTAVTTTTTTTTIPYKMEYLSNMELFANGSDGFTLNRFLADNYRNTYSSSISVEKGYLSYLVKDMGFTHFCGTVGLPKEISTDGYKTSAQLEIYIDEVLAFRSNEMTNESKPQKFDIDITNAEVVKLSWSCKGGNIWSDWCYFATVFEPYCADDSYISKISSESETTTVQNIDAQYLANMDLFADGSNNTTGGKSYMVNNFLEDNYGNAYASSVSVEKGYVSYLVKDMGYTKLYGTIALPKGISTDGYKTSAQLEIYIDDILALRSNEFTNESKPQEIDIDITGAEVIKFSWSCKGGNIWNDWCYYATVFDGKVTK